MADTLAALRTELDVMPSPVDEQPGLLIRDPFQYSDSTIIVPPLLARALTLFDGEHSELDLRAYLTRASGELQVSDVARHLIETLDRCGFLRSATFERMRERKHREFAAAPERAAAHLGSAYPHDPTELTQTLRSWGAAPSESANGELIGIAAPHVSPAGGYGSYAAAYSRLGVEHASKTFVILGTSHYGQPQRFGLTRKAYRTPLGAVETDQAGVDLLVKRAPDAIEMEDYCHASEHSIEFQSVFLQHLLADALPAGERLRAIPILCGSYFESLVNGKPPESNPAVAGFLDALSELAAGRDDLIWVLGVDMAHIGRRYGDEFAAHSEQGPLLEVRRRDQQRLERVCAGDAAGFYELVRPNQDELRWCGYAPIYTFIKALGGVRGEVLSYEQWNIDAESVVSFAGIEFVKGS